MAGNLQFSASYLPLEDRLLLLGSFPDRTEIRLLLTRRLTRGLLRGLEALSRQMAPAEAASPEAKRQAASFAREAAVAQADFGQSYEKGTPHPLMADGPRLVAEASFSPKRDAKGGERVAIALKLDRGERLNFTLPASGLWSLAHLLARQAGRAEWELEPAMPAPAPAQAAPGRLN